MSTETENQGIVIEGSTPEMNQPIDGGQPPVDDLQSAGDTAENAGTEINQEAVNKAINKKHYQYMTEKERADKLAAENEELRKKYESSHTPQERPSIPDLPDPFDPQYNEKMKARDDAFKAQLEFDHRQQNVQVQQQTAQQKATQEQQQKVAGMIHNFATNTQKLGLKPEEVAQAETVVASYIYDPSVRSHLMTVEDGPLIVKYLANNPFELEKVAKMDPISAGIHLRTAVSPEAAKLKPKTPGAPDPLTTPRGSGRTDENSDPLIAGAKFF